MPSAPEDFINFDFKYDYGYQIYIYMTEIHWNHVSSVFQMLNLKLFIFFIRDRDKIKCIYKQQIDKLYLPM